MNIQATVGKRSTMMDSERTKPLVAAIVPAYNEAGRIGQVVAVLCQLENLTAIIIVDDGSSDATGEEATRAAQGDPRLRVIRNPSNLGKGQSLFNGANATPAPFLLLVDADLVNLKSEHATALMEPVLRGEADMTMGIFQGGYWRTDAAHHLTPWLTGQRCLRASLFGKLSYEAASGYGFETALTLAAHHYQWRVRRVPLVGVTHLPGDVPRGSWRGPANKVKMYAHILRAWLVAGYWLEFWPRLAKRVRWALLVVITLVIGLVNSCALLTASAQNRLLARWIGEDTVTRLWGKVLSAIHFIQ